ncbi:MAG: (2Fe-2S) ferredoxin domain-containing protein [Clostridiales bacterium]|nr:(2Fe-2S) ferredoxin domain-containing protein [Clostridiales bacterium]HBM80911.1 NADH-quinone oxidoreductase subunit F [Clostridiaceae bacterium]
MFNVYICVGSSCHLKGSYKIIKIFQDLIKQYNLEDKIEIKASFCLGHCTNGVALKLGENFIDNVSITNAKDVFEKQILKEAGVNI